MSRISSRDALKVFAHDADLLAKVPERPRIISELIAFPYDAESLLVIGAPNRKVLSGPFCRTLLQDVWPRLDGSADVPALRADLERVPHLDEVLALLQRAALLENGGAEPAPQFPSEVAAFFGRHVPAAGYVDSRERAAALVQSEVVAVLASPKLAGRLVERLRDCGFVRALTGDELGHTTTSPTFYLVVGDENGFVNWADHVQANPNARVLLARVTDKGGAIGPLYLPARSPCLKCSIAAIESGAEAGSDGQSGFLIELLAQQVLGTVGHAEKRPLYSVSITHAEVDGEWSQRKLSIARTPGCVACGLGKFAPLEADSDQAESWRVLNSTMLPPWALLSKRVHEGHYSPANAALANQPEDVFDGRAVPLTLTAEEYTDASFEPSLGTLQMTGMALQVAYGTISSARGDLRSPRKLAPTGGGLRSPDAYAFLRGIDGIADGIYRYTPHGHKLQLVDDNVDIGLLEAAVGERLPECCSLVIGVARTKKLWPKYKTFSLRLGLLDSGVALSYLLDACWALGVPTHECADWRSELLLKLLQLPTCRRYYDIGSVTILGVSPPPAARGVSNVLDQELVQGLGRALPTSNRFGIDPPARWLMDARPPFHSLLEVAMSRTATRAFAPAGIDRDACSRVGCSILARAAALRTCGAAEAHARLLVLNNIGSSDFPAGAYAVGPDGALSLHSAVPSRQQVAECFNQQSLGGAPLVFIVAVDTDALLREQGAPGLAVALTRAAALLAHGWLVARTLGLEGCLSGGLIESELRARLGFDGYSTFPLFALAVGRKAGAAATADIGAD